MFLHYGGVKMTTSKARATSPVTPSLEASKIVLDVSGYMDKLSSINRQYHLTQVVDSNLPLAKSYVLQAIKDCFLAELNSKKQLEACKVVLEAVNEGGKDIIIKVIKNLWRDEGGKVVNNPSLKASEEIDYLKEYTINRKALIAYCNTPSKLSLLKDIFTVTSLIESKGKGSKRMIPASDKV